jgi:hypothetical protein
MSLDVFYLPDPEFLTEVRQRYSAAVPEVIRDLDIVIYATCERVTAIRRGDWDWDAGTSTLCFGDGAQWIDTQPARKLLDYLSKERAESGVAIEAPAARAVVRGRPDE